MKRAAARGIIDFSQARLHDRRWWMRLNWMLEELESSECKDFIALQTIKQAAPLSYDSGKQAFDHHWKQLGELTKNWISLSFPWLDNKKEASNDQLMKRWLVAHKLNDVNSPEAQAKIQKFTEDLKRMRGEERDVPQNSLSGNWCK